MTNYPNGQVILSIEKYNEMLAEIAAAKAEVTKIKSYFELQERTWSNTVELTVDKELVVQIATELLPITEFSKKYTLKDTKDIYYANTIVGELEIVEDTDLPSTDEDLI